MPLHRHKRPRAEHPFVGRWHITGMELWDEDYVNSSTKAIGPKKIGPGIPVLCAMAPRDKPRQSPFNVSLLAKGAHFADRETEVARIASAFRAPGSKLVVFGDRRLGKTSARERAAEAVRREGGMVAVPSFATAAAADGAPCARGRTRAPGHVG